MDDITIDIDPRGYLSSVDQVTSANTKLQQSFAGVVTQGSLVQRGLDAVTPKRAALLGWGALAQQAANTEQALSGIAATSTVTGIRTEKLAGTMRSLAREMPIGTAAARATVIQFTQMGVASEGSESKIAKLSTTVGKLSGATGAGPQELAQGMTDLARATGNTNLDPRRFDRLGDSLTTVSAQSGASATSILAFSKNIAPMATAAGIGATGVLGISSAFARLGEDGVGASTAVNKMLTDMSRAVREGGPELKTYAQITGQTVDAFTQLAKMNPAEALTQVTESIAKSGSSGPRQLEMLGLDGVRSMRALQALSASGGLRPAIATATNAYGSGSTNRAAEAAFGGLNDAVQELTDNLKETGEAFGAPLLGPLTTFANALKVPTNAARSVIQSDFMQKALQVGAVAAVSVMGARAIIGPLSALALGRQAATSGTARSFFGGYAAGGPGQGFASRYGARAIQLNEEGRLGEVGVMGPANQRIFNLMRGIREGRESAIAERMGPEAYQRRVERLQAGGGRNPLARLAGGVRNYGLAIGETFSNQLSEQMRNSRVPFEQRTSGWGFGAGVRGAGSAGREAFQARGGTRGGLDALTGGLKAFHEEIGKSTQGLRGFGNLVGAVSKAGAQTALAGGSMAFGGAKAAVGGVGSALKSVAGSGLALAGGAAGAALTGGIAAFQAYQDTQQRNQDAANEHANMDIRGELNAYRESIGKATDATQSVSTLSMSLGKTLATSTSTFEQARTVTANDLAAASGTKSNVTTQYFGSNQDVASQVGAMSVSGMSPSELQAVKVDLLRQRSQGDVEKIMGLLPSSVQATEGAKTPTGSSADAVAALATSIGTAPTQGGLVGFWNSLNTGPMGVREPRNYSLGRNGPSSPLNPGGGFYASNLSDQAREQVGVISQNIGQRYASQSQTYGADYAQQERLKAADEAMAAAIKSGNADLVNELSKNLTSDILGKENTLTMTAGDIQDRGGTFTKAIDSLDENFHKDFLEFQNRQTAAGGTFRPEEQESYVSKILAPVAPMIGKMFDSRTGSPVSQAVTASMNAPEDVAKQTTAINAMVDSAKAAGTSMAELGTQAAKAAGSLSEADNSFKLVRGAQMRAEQQMGREAQDQTPGQAMMTRYNYVRGVASQAPSNNPQVEQDRQAKQQEQYDIEGAMKDRLRARLQVQRQYEVQVSRSTEDFNRQQTYAQQDYGVQVSRMTRNFYIQQARAQQDYQKSVARAQEDFDTARFRQVRDFNISMARADEDYNVQRERQVRDFNIGIQRAEEDYLKTRMRAIRDFNTQMKRAVEDAAKSLYDPYSRIQSKATWDAKNLLANLGEQNEALKKQMDQLDQLRQMGLSSQAIDQLQLAKPENAQQVRNLVDDLSKDSSLVGQFNQSASTRQDLAGRYTNDDANVDMKRAREDFQKSLSDMETDYHTTLERNRSDLAKSMADQAEDFQKSVARAHQDLVKAMADQNAEFAKSLRRGNEDYTTSIKRAADDLHRGLKDMEADMARSMARQQYELMVSLSRMQQDIQMADEAIAGSMATLADQTNRAIHGQTLEWQKIIKNDTLSFVADMQQNVIPQVTAIAGQLGISIVRDPQNYGPAGSPSVVSGARHAEGGTIQGHSPHPKADNIPIMATAGEFMQPVDTVNYYGNDNMEKIRRRAIPRGAFDGYADGGLIGGVRRMADGGRVPIDGQVVDPKTYAIIKGASAMLGWAIRVTQGSWSTRVAASGGTHAGAGAADLVPSGSFSATVGGLRAKGGIAWHRTPSQGPWIQHIHMVTPGIPGLSPGAASQVSQYMRGGDGLGGRDPGPPVNFNGTGTIDMAALNAMAAGGSAPARPTINVDAIFSKMDGNRGGWYGKLRDLYKAKFAEKAATWANLAGGAGGGTVGGNSEVDKFINAIVKQETGGEPNPYKSRWGKYAISPTYVNSMAMKYLGRPMSNADYLSSPSNQDELGRAALTALFNQYGAKGAASSWYSGNPSLYNSTKPQPGGPSIASYVNSVLKYMGYDNGGFLQPGQTMTHNGTGKPEAVLTNEQWGGISKLAEHAGTMLSKEDGRALNAAAGGHLTINNNQRYTYDNGQHFAGAQFHIEANDSEALWRELQEIERAERVTVTRGVRRND